MIPLRTPTRLSRFPTAVLTAVIISVLVSILFGRFISSRDSQLVRMFLSTVIFPSLPLAILCGWYLWIFLPAYLNRAHRDYLMDGLSAALAILLALLFLQYEIEAALSYVFTLIVLGFVMRDQIWENVDTLVLGPRILSVFEVPCYVHVFFFFFYVFVCQLIQPAFGMPQRDVYLVALVCFVAGFLVRSLELKGLKDRDH